MRRHPKPTSGPPALAWRRANLRNRSRTATVGAHSAARHAYNDIHVDGRSDLLLENRGFNHWVMNGARVVRYSSVFAFPEGGYRPVFSGEFTGDGLLDLAWFRDRDTLSVVWTGDGYGFRVLPATAGYGGIPSLPASEAC